MDTDGFGMSLKVIEESEGRTAWYREAERERLRRRKGVREKKSESRESAGDGMTERARESQERQTERARVGETERQREAETQGGREERDKH